MPRKLKPKLVPRFYFEFAATAEEFRSEHKGTWQVFDRDVPDASGSGPDKSIALCANRHYAKAITEALNKAEVK